MTGPARPTLLDHLRVAALLVRSALSILWYVVWIPLSPVLRPWVRARVRSRLRSAPPALAEPPAPDPGAWEGKTVFVVAGETSGDRLAARVVRALRARAPGLRLRGYAGPACAEAGVDLDEDLTSRSVMGVLPVLLSIGRWWSLCARTLALWRAERPDAVFTVDFPGLNVRLATWARRSGIRAVHLVAPHIWAHAPWRVLRWRRAVDRLLATFPFEPVLFERSGIPTTYVGHPLFESPLAPPRTPESWPGGGPCTVEMLPGSRRREIEAHGAELVEAAAVVAERLPSARFVVRLAEPAHEAWWRDATAQVARRPSRLEVVVGDAPGGPPLLGAMASSGTVTAELAAALVPMSVFYRVSWLARLGERTLYTAPWFSLVNLVAGDDVVRERIYTFAGVAPGLASDFLAACGTPEAWSAQRLRLVEVRRRLERPAVADRAARALLDAASSAGRGASRPRPSPALPRSPA